MKEIFLPSVDSTNTYAKKHASTFSQNEITCITADEQTHGYGRQQRSWHSPAGVNLYITFYFQLLKSQRDITALGLVLASSLATVLHREGLAPRIKWPNDLQLNRRKFSGVLCELSERDGQLDVFAGIGINVNVDESELQQIGQPATSLKIETHRTWDRAHLLKALQTQFSSDLERFREKGFAPFHTLYEQFLAYKGERVRLLDGQREWVGVCHSLTSDGRLNVELEDRKLRAFASGEVSLRSQEST